MQVRLVQRKSHQCHASRHERHRCFVVDQLHGRFTRYGPVMCIGRPRHGHLLSLKDAVADFWQREACGERYGGDQQTVRYELEPEILRVANFPSGSGQRVLEIGVGMGADLVRWAREGATVVGVDLTQRAVDLTRARLANEGLSGVVEVADAEDLPYPDGAFDIVWSWGVLHHTPRADEALLEATRVLKPGGRYLVMVYHRHSWLALAAWTRFALLKGLPLRSLSKAISHIESPGTRAYTASEATKLLVGRLDPLTVRPVLTHWDKRVAPGLATLGGDRFGWFLVIQGVRRTD